MTNSTLLNPNVSGPLPMPILELFYKNRPIEVTPEQTPFLIGRENPRAALSVRGEFASREHCRIEFHEGKFLLKDISRNGTIVKLGIAPSFRLKGEVTPLMGSGSIHLGAEASATEACVLFKVNQRIF